MFGGKCSFRVTKVQELWNLVTPAHRDALFLSHESPGGDVAVVVKVRHHNTEPQMGMRIMLSKLFSLYVFDKVGHHNTEPQMGIMLSLLFSLYVFDKVGHLKGRVS